MPHHQKPDSDGTGKRPDGIMGTLIQQQIVSEQAAKSFLSQDTIGIKEQSFARILDELKASGLLSDFQRRRISDDGAEAVRMGPYVLLDYIGKGGMGEVLLARHVDLDRVVALKVLPPQLTDSTERRERFRREVRLLAKLDHPGIVKAVDAGEWKQIPYLAMEYVTGGTLHDMLQQDGPIAWNRMIRWMLVVCEAIGYAHAQGIIHRDIKPSNLAVDEQRSVKVLDLGLARATQFDSGASTEGFATSADQMLGTADFMPPEQSAGDVAVGPTADIYSLGCTIYTLLTGRPIFPGSNVLEKVMSHRRDTPPSVLEMRPEVPKELDALILRMVAKEPKDRPQSMELVRDRLSEIAEQYQLGDSSHPPSEDRSQPEQNFVAAGSTVPQSRPVTVANSAYSLGSQTSPMPIKDSSLGLLVAGIVGAVALMFLGGAGVLYLRGDLSPRPEPVAESMGVENEKRSPVTGGSAGVIQETASSVPDVRSTNQLSELLGNLLLFGAEVSLLKNGSTELQTVTSEELPKTLPATTRFAVRMDKQRMPLPMLERVVEQQGLVSLSLLSPEENSIPLKTISQAESLSKLEIDAGAFNESDIPWLKRSLSLREIVIHHATGPEIMRLSKLDQVERLSFPERTFGDDALQALSSMKWLKRLELPIDGLSPPVIQEVFLDLPRCICDFSAKEDRSVSKLLLLLKRVDDPASVQRASLMIASHQELLLEQRSMNSYWGLEEYTRYREFSSLGPTEQVDLASRVLELNERLRELVPEAERRRLLQNAGQLWGYLAETYHYRQSGESSIEKAVACYQSAILALQEGSPQENAAEIANRMAGASLALSKSDPNASQNFERKASQQLELAGSIESLVGAQVGDAFWAWNRLGMAAMQRNPESSLRYFENAVRVVHGLTPSSVQPYNVSAVLNYIELQIATSRYGEAKDTFNDNRQLLSFSETQTQLGGLLKQSLCLECAVAIFLADRARFVEITDALAALSEWVKPDWLNAVGFDLMQLRGWNQPYEPGEIKLNVSERSGLLQVQKQIAEGKLDINLLSNVVKEPVSGPEGTKYQALRLRLAASDPPTIEQQSQAAEILARAEEHDIYVRAVVVGLLGPTTGTPLTDVSSVTADKSAAEGKSTDSTIQNAATDVEQQP